jgi:hypothetical protein
MKCESPITYLQTIWSMLDFFKSGSNFKVTRSCHKEHTYEKYEIHVRKKTLSLTIQHVNVKVFADRQTDTQLKTICCDLSIRGHKKYQLE